MSSSMPVPPPRFVVQCAKGKGWKTLVIDENQAAAERAFHEVVKVNPRGFFRLIRLDDKPGAEVEGQEFSWKLLNLHDPRKSPGGTSAKTTTVKAARPRKATAAPRQKPAAERVRIPFRLYTIALIVGALLAVAAYLHFGPR